MAAATVVADEPGDLVAGNSLGGAIALELAAAGLVASATALSPAGFFTAAERRRAMLILTTLRANTHLPSAVLRALLRSPAIRAASFAPLVTHPARLTPDRALGDALALRRGRGFRPVARAARHYQFTGTPAVPVTVAWGTRDRVLPPRQVALSGVQPLASASPAAGSQSRRNWAQRAASSVSPISPAASASWCRLRRKPRFGPCDQGTGPEPRHPLRRSWSSPR